MKKLTLILLALICAMSFSACKSEGESISSADTESKVLSLEENSEEALDIIPLTFGMLPLFEVASSVDDIPSNSQNPWTSETEPHTMPVMKKGNKLMTTLDATQKANEIAMKLGLAIGSANVNEGTDGSFWVGLACAEGLQTVTISVNELGEVYIIYQNGGKAIPSEYKEGKFDWLVDTYAPLFIGGETVKYGDGNFGTVYKKGDTVRENIINYFFNNVSYAEDLNLDMVSMQMTYTGTLQRVTAKCVDYYTAVEYPIISLDVAKNMLSDGKCYLSVTENEFTAINRESVVSVAFVYGMRSTETHIPCYLFWVEAERDGQSCYVPFTVPAIDPEYLDISGIDSLMEINK